MLPNEDYKKPVQYLLDLLDDIKNLNKPYPVDENIKDTPKKSVIFDREESMESV